MGDTNLHHPVFDVSRHGVYLVAELGVGRRLERLLDLLCYGDYRTLVRGN